MSLFQIATLLIPIISACVIGILTYSFALKSKKFDILYQNKIPAFKETALKLTEYRNFCLGRVACLRGDEFSPFWEEGSGTLHHRTEIANVVAINSIFFSKSNRVLLDNLLSRMSANCNMEIWLISDPDLPCDPKRYEDEAIEVERIIEVLYKDLNLH